MIAPLLAIVRIARVPAIVSNARALCQLLDALHQILLIVESVEEGHKQRQHGCIALHELLILSHFT